MVQLFYSRVDNVVCMQEFYIHPLTGDMCPVDPYKVPYGDFFAEFADKEDAMAYIEAMKQVTREYIVGWTKDKDELVIEEYYLFGGVGDIVGSGLKSFKTLQEAEAFVQGMNTSHMAPANEE